MFFDFIYLRYKEKVKHMVFFLHCYHCHNLFRFLWEFAVREHQKGERSGAQFSKQTRLSNRKIFVCFRVTGQCSFSWIFGHVNEVRAAPVRLLDVESSGDDVSKRILQDCEKKISEIFSALILKRNSIVAFSFVSFLQSNIHFFRILDLVN